MDEYLGYAPKLSSPWRIQQQKSNCLMLFALFLGASIAPEACRPGIPPLRAFTQYVSTASVNIHY